MMKDGENGSRRLASLELGGEEWIRISFWYASRRTETELT